MHTYINKTAHSEKTKFYNITEAKNSIANLNLNDSVVDASVWGFQHFWGVGEEGGYVMHPVCL